MIGAGAWSRAALYVVLLGSVLPLGADRGLPLAGVQLGTLVAALAWLVSAIGSRRFEWRRTPLDLPLAVLLGLCLAQILLGNRPLVAWALAPASAAGAAEPFPAPLLALGTIAPAQTLRSLSWFLTYAAIYFVVVNVVRERAQLERLVRTIVTFGGLLAFFALLDYVTRGTWLGQWRWEYVGERLAGSFANPDHFASWLGMAIFLGIGDLMSRRGAAGPRPSLRGILHSREAREALIRRHLPFVGLALMSLAIVFTLSRGGIASLLVALLGLLLVSGVLGRTRWSLVLVGVLLAVTLAYGTWIGIEPLLRRFEAAHAHLGSRLSLYSSSLPMLRDFPLLGVGLGAYKDIYFRYQPPALGPGATYYAYAHSDLLQLALELGLLGVGAVLFAVWRVARDLLGAHLLGHGRCAVGGGQGESARRHHRFSIGIGLGALGGALVLLVHSTVDFSARIPANGVLAAACLGIATVALHTRFRRDAVVLTDIWTIPLGRRPLVAAAAVVVLLGSLGFAHAAIRDARMHSLLLAAAGNPGRALDAALALNPDDPNALRVRGGARLEAGAQLWQWGTPSTSVAARAAERHEAQALLEGALSDLRLALSQVPTDSVAHERLGWTHAMLGLVEPAGGAAHVPAAVAHLRRAITLAPENALRHRSLAALALTMTPPLLTIAVESGREAVARQPALLPDLVERLAPHGLDSAHWLALVPPTAVDRIHLAVLLEARGLGTAAQDMYVRAVEVAAPSEAVFARWALARSLLRRGAAREALEHLQLATGLEPDNPELELARGQALTAMDAPDALDAYRSAVAKALAPSSRPRSTGNTPFGLADVRARVLATALLGPGDATGALRYRRALARALVDRRAWAEARQEWETIQTVAPKDAAAHYYRALALDHLGAAAQALDDYRQAIALDGQDVRVRLRYARRLWEADRYIEAIREWQQVTQLAPQNVEARASLVRAHLKLGDKVDAWREYQEVVRLAPDHPDARRGFDALLQAERRSAPTSVPR
jgi:tetratricopeptide (TPR) repeat protein/O-antigen ligase